MSLEKIRSFIAFVALLGAALVAVPVATADDESQAVDAAAAGPLDALDPIRNSPLGCQARPAPGSPGRSQRGGIDHQAYVCGIAGTDMELQSRKDANGFVHDYAFAGTVGEGFRIFDVTDPKNPRAAGATRVTGYQNDPVIRGNYAFQAYDGVSGNPVNASPCLQGKVGVDIFKLNYDPKTANFTTSLVSCVATGPGGAHTATIHPSGRWLAVSNAGSRAIDIVDLTNLANASFENKPPIKYRIIDATNMPKPGESNNHCPQGATFKCVVAQAPDGQPATRTGPDGTTVLDGCSTNATGSPGSEPNLDQYCFRPHDVFFSRDGKTMYCACLNSTFAIDVTRALDPGLTGFPTLSIIENRFDPVGAPDSPNNIFLSHQADTSPDGKILVVGDERGGGTSELGCNEPGGGISGVLHFFALAPIRGVPNTANASPRNPVKLGIYLNPSPTLPAEAGARAERGCTVHVFRIGGNGSGAPGEGANQGFGGVSTLNSRQLVTAWYGAAVWYLDFSSPPDRAPGDDIEEAGQTTWGNTLAWNVQPGADTWSAKEYKGKILAGDLARGFDVYTMTRRAYSAPGFEAGTAGTAGGPAGPSCLDRVKPRSVLKPRGFKRRGRRLSARGRASDLSCRLPGRRARAAGRVRRVAVSIARVQRKGCRFVTRKGLLQKTRSCRRPTLMRARGTKRWRFAMRARLPRGNYRIVVRATDAAGNKERPAGRRNVVRFRVR